MLKTVHFQNLRALRDVRLALEPFTVLVGPNGCGKSTILDELERLCQFSRLHFRSQNVLGSVGDLLHQAEVSSLATHGTTEALQWSAGADSGASMRVSCTHPGSPKWYDHVFLEAWDGKGANTSFRASTTRDDRPALEAFLARAFSWNALRLQLVPRDIATPVDARMSGLLPGGFGLAAVLAELALNDQAAYAALQNDLRAVVPHFERLHIRRENLADPSNPTSTVGGFALSMVFRGAGIQPAERISDGTLLALALLTVLHTADGPNILLLDDLDHGLHPRGQYELVSAIRAVLKRRPGLQVVCTTHSPYLLDAVRPEEVRVVNLNDHGHTVVDDLTDSPHYRDNALGLQTGELWTSLGEDWVGRGADTNG